jgi:hypothetical protein
MSSTGIIPKSRVEVSSDLIVLSCLGSITTKFTSAFGPTSPGFSSSNAATRETLINAEKKHPINNKYNVLFIMLSPICSVFYAYSGVEISNMPVCFYIEIIESFSVTLIL